MGRRYRGDDMHVCSRQDGTRPISNNLAILARFWWLRFLQTRSIKRASQSGDTFDLVNRVESKPIKNGSEQSGLRSSGADVSCQLPVLPESTSEITQDAASGPRLSFNNPKPANAKCERSE
jgi:hypothetical protein